MKHCFPLNRITYNVGLQILSIAQQDILKKDISLVIHRKYFKLDEQQGVAPDSGPGCQEALVFVNKATYARAGLCSVAACCYLRKGKRFFPISLISFSLDLAFQVQIGCFPATKKPLPPALASLGSQASPGAFTHTYTWKLCGLGLLLPR